MIRVIKEQWISVLIGITRGKESSLEGSRE